MFYLVRYLDGTLDTFDFNESDAVWIPGVVGVEEVRRQVGGYELHLDTMALRFKQGAHQS